jgi:hypothetical protein
VIAQGRFDALIRFVMHLGQREYGEYSLDDEAVRNDNIDRVLDYHSGVRRLENQGRAKGGQPCDHDDRGAAQAGHRLQV